MENLNAYPLKYSEMLIKKKGKILEAGCGAGRLLRFYHDKGHDIIGIDFIDGAIEKLKKIDSSLQVKVGDITDLDFENETFNYILAFGLYHNFEDNLDKSIVETYRVLKNGGQLCASFRADNFQTKITDWLYKYRNNKKFDESKLSFHKMNLNKSEFKKLFIRHGFAVKEIMPVENMPFLFKFKFFRVNTQKNFNESIGREKGYRLSFFGNILQKLLITLFPNQFCNVFVMIAEKNE